MVLISIYILEDTNRRFPVLVGYSAKIESIDFDRFRSAFCARLIKHVLRATLIPEDNGSSGSQLNKQTW